VYMCIATRYEEIEKEGHFDLVSLHSMRVHAYTTFCTCTRIHFCVQIYMCVYEYIVTGYEEMEREGRFDLFSLHYMNVHT